jgi:hypothetical protein
MTSLTIVFTVDELFCAAHSLQVFGTIYMLFLAPGRTLTKKEEEFSNYITEIQLVKSLGYPFLTRSNEEEAEEEKRRDPRPNFSKRGT